MKCDAVVEKAWQWKGCEKIDVLEGTALEKWGKELGFGLWLFRRKIPVRHVRAWAAQCAEMFSGHGRAMKVGKRVGAYDTIQATIRTARVNTTTQASRRIKLCICQIRDAGC